MSIPAGFGLFNAGDNRRQAIGQTAENSSRPAICTMTYHTTGVGYIVVPQPLLFDVLFTAEPAIATGVAIVKAPDTRYWQYPSVTAGIYRWERDRNGYYRGAYPYFTVKCDPTTDVTDYTQQIAQAQGQIAYYNTVVTTLPDDRLAQLQSQAEQRYTEIRAQQAATAPTVPDLMIAHHLYFQGPATKDLSGAVGTPSGPLPTRSTDIIPTMPGDNQ